MIDWIDDLGKSWGRYMRAGPKTGYSTISVMGRIAEEGPVGASIRTYYRSIPPVNDMPGEVREFHRAWCSMSGVEKILLFVQYVPAVKVKEKIGFLNVKRRSYYAQIDRAHIEIWRVMDLQNR